jgi:hypothetical protein
VREVLAVTEDGTPDTIEFEIPPEEVAEASQTRPEASGAGT